MTLLHKSVISRSKGNYFSHSLSFFFPQSRIWTKYPCKTGTGLYKYRTGLLKEGDGWKWERGQKYLGFGPATSPWLSLLTLFTDLALIKFPSKLNPNWPPEQNPWRWTTGLRNSDLSSPVCRISWPWTTQIELISSQSLKNSNPAARSLYLSMWVQPRFN